MKTLQYQNFLGEKSVKNSFIERLQKDANRITVTQVKPVSPNTILNQPKPKAKSLEDARQMEWAKRKAVEAERIKNWKPSDGFGSMAISPMDITDIFLINNYDIENLEGKTVNSGKKIIREGAEITSVPMFINGQRTVPQTMVGDPVNVEQPVPSAMASLMPAGIDSNLMILAVIFIIGLLLFKQ